MSNGNDQSFIDNETNREQDKDVMKYKKKKTQKVILFPTDLARRKIGGGEVEKNSKSTEDKGTTIV